MTEKKEKYITNQDKQNEQELPPPMTWTTADFEKRGRELRGINEDWAGISPVSPEMQALRTVAPKDWDKFLTSARNKDPLDETNKLMYHGINSGLFLYGSAWTSAIIMLWCMFLGVVQSSAIAWVIIAIMILVGLLNYPSKEARQLPDKNKDGKNG